jgi:hypothetical protein
MKISFYSAFQRGSLLSGCIFSVGLLPTLALADAKYTTVTSVSQSGALKPMSTVTTWLKPGFERTDSQQDLGFYKSSEAVISSRAGKKKITFDPALKIFVEQPLNAPASSGTGGTGGGTSKGGLGTLILTLGAKFLGREKMMNYPVRHYTTSISTESSGCCGTGKMALKTETWMADIKLPVFDAGSPAFDWRTAYTQGRSDCRINFQRKGDIKGFEAAQKGLALKTITFDATGKPLASSQITSLSMAALGNGVFTIPTGCKKVTRAEYDAARAKAMMAAMNPEADSE